MEEEALRAEETARKTRRDKFRNAAASVLKGNSILTKLKNQAERET
jgi:hypothetical protein